MPKRPKNIKVRAFIYQCRDLPSADSDGTSDPFLEITDSDTPKRTITINDNVNPIYYQALDMIYEANRKEDLPPFIIDCYDEDQTLVGKNDQDFLARATIYLQEGDDKNYNEVDVIQKPVWHPMRYKPDGPVSGEVLCSFTVVDDDFSFKRDLDYVKLENYVETKEFQVSMNVLGLRGLQSPGILPVQKAFVNFNLKGFVSPAIGTNLKNLKTDPKAPGPDPTINTMMKFFVPLPIDELYCPRLSCQVYDQVFAGFSQPIIGNFTIPIGELMHELAKERKTEIAQLEGMVEKLGKVAAGEERASILAQSMRKMVAQKGGDSNLVAMTPEQKKKFVNEFSSKNSNIS